MEEDDLVVEADDVLVEEDVVLEEDVVAAEEGVAVGATSPTAGKRVKARADGGGLWGMSGSSLAILSAFVLLVAGLALKHSKRPVWSAPGKRPPPVEPSSTKVAYAPVPTAAPAVPPPAPVPTAEGGPAPGWNSGWEATDDKWDGAAGGPRKGGKRGDAW